MEEDRYQALVLKRRQFERLLLANLSEADLAHERDAIKDLHRLLSEGQVLMAHYVEVINEIEKA